MTGTKSTPDTDQPDAGVAFVVAGVLAQVGCVTLLIITLSILGGLWLDTQFDTRPLFTVVLVVASVPVTVYLIIRFVLRFTASLREKVDVNNTKVEIEEGSSGEDS